MEAKLTAELENYNQNISLYEACLMEWLKKEYPKSPQIAKTAHFLTEKSRKVQGKFCNKPKKP